MICPLQLILANSGKENIDPKCLEHQCAWWDESPLGQNSMCAILAISKEIYCIRDQIRWVGK